MGVCEHGRSAGDARPSLGRSAEKRSLSMQSKHAEPPARSFDAMSAIGLSEEARKAVNEAFDAMSTWRIETAKSSEENSEQVIEKMAAAARALGWPGEIVDVIRTQIQSIT